MKEKIKSLLNFLFREPAFSIDTRYEKALKKRFERFVSDPSSVPREKVLAMVEKIRERKESCFERAYSAPMFCAPYCCRTIAFSFYNYNLPLIQEYNFWKAAEDKVRELL